MESLILDLLGNAIKYSQEGTMVNLEVSFPVAEDRLVIMVSDEGPGIPADEQERVFEKYYRAKLTKQSTQGSGLGLYIVKRLCEALAGGIELESKEGAGSRFMVRLPCKQIT